MFVVVIVMVFGDVGDCGFSGDIVGECTWVSPMSVTKGAPPLC